MAPWEGLFLEPTSLLTRRFGGNIRTFSSGMDLALELAAEDGGEGAMLSSLFGKLRGVSQEKIRLASITDFRNRWGS